MKKIMLGLMLILGICLCGSQTAFASESTNDTFEIDGVVYTFDDFAQSYIDKGWNYFVVAYYHSSSEDGIYELAEIQFAIYAADAVCGLAPRVDGRFRFVAFEKTNFDNYISIWIQKMTVTSDGLTYDDTMRHSSPEYYFDVFSATDGYWYSKMVYSSNDVYACSAYEKKPYVLDYDTVFFRQTPVLTKSLPKIAEKAGLAGVTEQVVRILPIAIPMVVCYLGLRKGLKLLGNICLRA